MLIIQIALGIILAFLLMLLWRLVLRAFAWVLLAVTVGALLLWFRTTSAGQWKGPDWMPVVYVVLGWGAFIFFYLRRKKREEAEARRASTAAELHKLPPQQSSP